MRNMSCVYGHKQASGSPIRSPGPTEISSPERCPSEERLLLHELSHRINNEFASAISLIALAAARSANTEVKIALDAVQDRLQSYAQVHHVLQMPGTASASRGTLICDSCAGPSAARSSTARASSSFSWYAPFR
jgi:two-component sensor histidine kinase